MIRVAVVEENEIFRRGLVDSLSEDPSLDVVAAGATDLPWEEVDVAVVSGGAARTARFSCPMIIIAMGSEGSPWGEENEVAGIICRASMTAAQLRATVHAAAAGLTVTANAAQMTEDALEPRSRRLLELMADGCSTREIADRMSYSERTIKKRIAELERRLHAQTRAQTVAQAIRRGLI